MIAEADAARRGAPVPSVASPPTTATPDKASTPAAAESSAITGRVTLDPKLRDRVGANDTLFIFARSAQGPRMPLAVVRSTAAALPHDFRLDDSMAMAPNARLSGAGGVIVEARISKTGNAMPSAGDLQGTSTEVKPGTRGVSIVIDTVVP